MVRTTPRTRYEFVALAVAAVVVVGFASSAFALAPIGGQHAGPSDDSGASSTPTNATTGEPTAAVPEDAPTETAGAPTETASPSTATEAPSTPSASTPTSAAATSSTATPSEATSVTTASAAGTTTPSDDDDATTDDRSGAASPPASTATPTSDGETDERTPDGTASDGDDTDEPGDFASGEKPPSGITSGVADLVRETTAGPDAQSRGSDAVVVRLNANPGRADEALSAAENAGGDLQAREDTRVVVEVPAGAIDGLRTHSAVQSIQLPDRPRLPAGSITSEGIHNVSAPALHAEGVTGEDVTVAVIDLDGAHSAGGGFDATNGEIADNVVDLHDPTSGESFTNASGRHGTAVSEVVVDTAPNASLMLIEIQTGTEIENAIDYARANGADTIVMSLGISTGPFDGSGPIGDNIQAARDAGIPTFVSAGNAGGGKHLNVTWNDPDGDDYLEFSGSDDTLDVTTQAGVVTIDVSWNDYPTSSEDYDLVLLNSAGDVVAESRNAQSGSLPPQESLAASASECPCELLIEEYSASGNADFDVFANDGTTLGYSTAVRSVTRPATDEAAITVGAVGWQSLNLEPFSSQGPTVDGRLKPEISAPDAVSTSVYGQFHGTSAAAPHAAGVAALLQEANASITPSTMEDVLNRTASQTDASYASPDPNVHTGHGLIDASAAYDEMRPLLDGRWSVDTGSAIQYARAAVDDERVYAGGLDDTLYAIDRETGDVDWQFDRRGSLADSSPALAGGQVVVGSGGGSIYALDRDTGAPNWNTTTQSAVVSSPGVDGDAVYVGLNNGSLLALDNATGDVQWRYGGSVPIYSTVDVADGTVYANLNNGTVLALKASNGAVEWSFDTGAELGYSSPVASGSAVFVAADQVYALDASNGTVLWSESHSGTAGASPVLDDGTLYVGSDAGVLRAIDVSAETIEWTHDAGSPIRGSPGIARGTVVVTNASGGVHLLDQSTGSFQAATGLDAPTYASIAAAGDAVFVGAEDGVIHAFENLV